MGARVAGGALAPSAALGLCKKYNVAEVLTV